MKQQYYYIVSGLADITLESEKNVPDEREFITDLKEIIQSGEDRDLLDCILLYKDNRNLFLVLTGGDASGSEEGVFTVDELQEEVKTPDRIPGYMVRAVEEFRESPDTPGNEFEDRINALFYEEMASHENPFIREWFSFERDLRNILSGLKIRKFRELGLKEDFIDPEAALIGDTEVSEAVKRSSSPDFSLSNSFDYIEELLSLEGMNPLDKEWKIDLIKWKFLDEITLFSYFEIETILAFTIKLGMINRWQRLTEEKGEERLESIIAGLESTFSISGEL
ncbi:MAG: DUF2764 family protein [Chitinivibrionales bacterium]